MHKEEEEEEREVVVMVGGVRIEIYGEIEIAVHSLMKTKLTTYVRCGSGSAMGRQLSLAVPSIDHAVSPVKAAVAAAAAPLSRLY